MNITFDVVRIGSFRKNSIAEKILEQNTEALKSQVTSFLKNHSYDEEIALVLIIPGKGYNIKIALAEIRNDHIRKEISRNFSKSIYKGKYSLLTDNINTPIFRGKLRS